MFNTVVYFELDAIHEKPAATGSGVRSGQGRRLFLARTNLAKPFPQNVD